MRVLVADDDADMRAFFRAVVEAEGDEALLVSDGETAWRKLGGEDPPALALLNWIMPGLDGLELTRRIRARTEGGYTYVVLATARDRRDDFLAAMRAGVDDFVSKPVDAEVLLARLRVGKRILALQEAVSALGGTVGVCSWCARVKDEVGRWQGVEEYLGTRTRARFSHGLCDACYARERAAYRKERDAEA